jgi:hypothetical protein
MVKLIKHFGISCVKITTKLDLFVALNNLQDHKKKTGVIKHDVAKFCGCYRFIVALNESRSSLEITL